MASSSNLDPPGSGHDVSHNPRFQPSPENPGLRDCSETHTDEALLSDRDVNSMGQAGPRGSTASLEEFNKAHETLNTISDSINKMVKSIEKIARSYDSESSGTNSGAESENENEDEDEDENEDEEQDNPMRNDLIPEAKECDLLNFKERVKGQRRYVLDFLLAGRELSDEIRAWKDKRFSSTPTAKQKDAGNKDVEPRSKDNLMKVKDKNLAIKDQAEHHWIHRVRINSIPVIDALAKLAAADGIPMPEFLQNRPLTFRRPFSLIIHHYERIQELLSHLQSDSETASSQSVLPQGGDNIGGMDRRGRAFVELKCFAEFVEHRIMPDYLKWQKTDGDVERQQIRFDDLPYLFKLGELAYCRPHKLGGDILESTEEQPGLAPHIGMPEYHRIRRVVAVHSPQTSVTSQGPLGQIARKQKRSFPADSCCIFYYFIDFDGDKWGPKGHWSDIPSFEGRRDVTTLPIYPLRFFTGRVKALSQAIADGQAVVDVIQSRFGFYSGWSLMNSPGTGSPATDTEGNVIKSPTHIESEVLVDYTETFNTYPPWQTTFSGEVKLQIGVEDPIDWQRDKPNILWADDNRASSDSSPVYMDEYIVTWDGTDTLRFNSYIDTDEFCKDGLEGTRIAPSGEDLALISRRFFAYSVWHRKFLHLDIRSLLKNVIGEKGKAFEQLQLPDESHKGLIGSLVQSHFDQKTFQSKHHIDIQGQDLIRGKGKGLVFLLHGVPGVGKTATAEAVAQKWDRPLFPITCGDLGLTSESVEKSLNEVFRLAQLWDCVLLLDEADVFITERVKVGDLQRNGLVSVFLRMLEYYNGILFLTTNRPGVLDEAVKSRVHLSLRYDHLDEAQTVKLFEFNVDRMREIEDLKSAADPEYRKLHLKKGQIVQFGRDHYKKYASEKGIGRWNGRQIRNAFLIAASLAHYGEPEDEDDKELQKQLNKGHFEKVDKTTVLYDNYRRGMFNKDDDARAFEKEER